MSLLPKALENAIEALGQLPGVGPRSAERYAYYLLKNDSYKTNKLIDAFSTLHKGVKLCPVTFVLIDNNCEVSPLYTNPGRDKSVIAVVSDPFDVIAIEKTGLFKGTYHVLGGLISPIDGVTPDDLKISELVSRIKSDGVKELILAMNASVEGETTSLYLQQQLEDQKVIISRLARGLSVGVDLEYADHISLGRALTGRQKM
ncbi:MAG: recombination mediator RecR [bacterium]